jgi:hypothetical protein
MPIFWPGMRVKASAATHPDDAILTSFKTFSNQTIRFIVSTDWRIRDFGLIGELMLIKASHRAIEGNCRL